MWRTTIPCSSKGCKHQTDTWYSCCKDCKYEVGFCKDCGGLSRAEREMLAHKVGCVPTYANSKPTLVNGTPPLPSCDGNPYAHADIIEHGGQCPACGLVIVELTAPSRQLDVSVCEVCGKAVQGAGRRCCEGIGKCFLELHRRDQEKRLDRALFELKRKWLQKLTEAEANPTSSCYGINIEDVIEDAFEAGRKF
jgi:hypothetical protein